MITNQSQKHGFIWENEIKKYVFDLPEDNNNTDIHDIPAEKNKFNKNENISIKTTKSLTICCGDIKRFFSYDFTKKNTIIVIHYKQKGIVKTIKNIYEINYTKECHKLLFGSLSYNEIEQYITNVKNIPKNISRIDAKNNFNYIVEKKDLTQKHKCNILINPKVDSKTQRRVQCSIKNFNVLLKEFITYKSSSEKPNILREKEIKNNINSPPRKRN